MPRPESRFESPVRADATYGSDRMGLVWGYVFTSSEAGQPLSSDDAVTWLEKSSAEGLGFVWLHFNVAHAASESWLKRHLALPDAFYEVLHQGTAQGGSSTRVELAEQAIVAVLNDVHFFAGDTTDASTVTLCANRRLLVTARTTPLRSVDRLRAAVKAGEGFRSTAELVAHLLRDQADVLMQIVREATVKVDVTEDRLFTGRGLSSRAMLGSLRRVLVRLQRLLAPEPAALFRLLTRPPAWMRPEDVSDLRQSAEELSAAVADSAALVERVRLLQEELIALINERTSRTLFVLTVVTVLALPLTIIPGLLGMNIGGLPLVDHDRGFLIVVAILAVVTVTGASLAFARWRQS